MTDSYDPAANIEVAGFADADYADRYVAARPRPPADLVDLLLGYARTTHAALVVDLGCGPGTSTGIWVGRADRVVGVEPSEAMLAAARRMGPDEVEWRQGFGQDTGLAADEADVVVCSQSFHWMDPQPTLAEVARVLRPGGVFAAADHDLPAVDADVERAAMEVGARAGARSRELGLARPVHWPKDRHLAEIEASGHFAYAREVVMHAIGPVGPDDFVEQTRSVVHNGPVAAGWDDAASGLDELRGAGRRVLGPDARWVIGYRVRLGVRA